MSKTVYLVLENGKVFQGKGFGAEGEVTAEVVFTTGMTGYLETLTDQSYHGQMVIQTFPLIGNYGVIPADFESNSVGPCAYIVKNRCQNPSNFRSEGDLDTFLKDRGIVGIYDVDTRALTRIIRESGVMNGKIVSDMTDIDWEEIRNYQVTKAVSSVTRTEVEVKNMKDAKPLAATNDVVLGIEKPEVPYKVALLDFGLKDNIVRELNRFGCDVSVYPGDTDPQVIINSKPDGIMLSNGPGDPAENVQIIENLKVLAKSGIAIFGICLGHQLLALANGFSTYKLKYGHRGGNQPAKDLVTGKIYITSQNHGYAVSNESIDSSVAVERFINVNDGTCEGIDYKNTPAFSVQFHPEGSGGPRDTETLFIRFTDLMKANVR